MAMGQEQNTASAWARKKATQESIEGEDTRAGQRVQRWVGSVYQSTKRETQKIFERVFEALEGETLGCAAHHQSSQEKNRGWEGDTVCQATLLGRQNRQN